MSDVLAEKPIVMDDVKLLPYSYSNDLIERIIDRTGMYKQGIKQNLMGAELNVIYDMMHDELILREEEFEKARQKVGYNNAVKEMHAYTLIHAMCSNAEHSGMFNNEGREYLKELAEVAVETNHIRGWVLLAWYYYTTSRFNCKNPNYHPDSEAYFTILYIHGFFPKELLPELKEKIGNWMHLGHVQTRENREKYLKDYKKMDTSTWKITA